MILQIGHQILEHLTPGPLLHPGEVGGGVGGPLRVHDLGQKPLPEHGALVKGGLLPEVRLVRTHFVPGHHGNLVGSIKGEEKESIGYTFLSCTSYSNICLSRTLIFLRN